MSEVGVVDQPAGVAHSGRPDGQEQDQQPDVEGPKQVHSETVTPSWREILRRAREGATKTGVPLEVYLVHYGVDRPRLPRRQWRAALASPSSEARRLLARARLGSAKTGIPLAVYLAHLLVGESWCAGHQDFHPEGSFGSRRVYGVEYRRTWCRQWAAHAEPRWQMAQRQAARRKGHTGRCLGPVPEGGCYQRWGSLHHRHCACGQPMAQYAQRCGVCETRYLWVA